MGTLTNFYRYVIRENWLRLTGRHRQAEAEADAWAFADADADMAAARERAPYRRYLEQIEEWRREFEAAVSRMEEGHPHRRGVLGPEELADLPEIPEPGFVFGFPAERLADRAAMATLRIETAGWREDRLRRARERLGVP